ncbi:hypothetical protein OESDEN_05885 [Oesophagostomum dentatum]|uniref:Extracellular Endonuclease subunit A domain-containing protein n=1 Tax=Oesophagostomum dentatum TaxID=61180 RepID=A0A0B1TFP3_OESDE|nr:hypothetical protein OESDEN_05885 [Oesophagostomum dentatum]
MCNMTHALTNYSLDIICGECSTEDEEIFANWAKCSVNGASKAITVSSDTTRFCHMEGCNDMAILDDTTDFPYLTTLIEEYTASSNERLLSNNCTFHLMNVTSPCQRAEINDTVEYRTLSAFPGRVIANDFSLITPWKTKFIEEILDPLNEYTKKIVKKLGRVVSITGTAYDEDYDGKHSSTAPISQYPTHLYRILIACDGYWSSEGSYCRVSEQTKALSFIFPHMNGDPNCLDKNELLLQYTARIKDVESISGQYFNFTNMSDRQQMLLKTHINVELW